MCGGVRTGRARALGMYVHVHERGCSLQGAHGLAYIFGRGEQAEPCDVREAVHTKDFINVVQVAIIAWLYANLRVSVQGAARFERAWFELRVRLQLVVVAYRIAGLRRAVITGSAIGCTTSNTLMADALTVCLKYGIRFGG